MKFDFIIGNPPYQEEKENNGRKPPIYHRFMDAAYNLGRAVELITPARFLFNAGQTPKDWNEKMLNDEHFKVLYFEADGAKIFPTTDIKGGIVITYRDPQKEFGKIKTFFMFDEMKSILSKVLPGLPHALCFGSIIASQGLYRFSRHFFEQHPNASRQMGAGTGNKIVSNIIERLPDIFTNNPGEGQSVKFLSRINNRRIYKYIRREYLYPTNYLDTYNVLVPESNGSGIFGETLSIPEISKPGTGHVDTFLSIGQFATQYEAEACMKYIKTKFARTMLGILKVTQHNPPATWKYVPLQKFALSSDIDWSKSVAEIDRQLYAKYGLSDEEINFIETHVKEMA